MALKAQKSVSSPSKSKKPGKPSDSIYRAIMTYRKNVYAMLQAESDEDVLLKEIDQYIDGMLMNVNFSCQISEPIDSLSLEKLRAKEQSRLSRYPSFTEQSDQPICQIWRYEECSLRQWFGACKHLFSLCILTPVLRRINWNFLKYARISLKYQTYLRNLLLERMQLISNHLAMANKSTIFSLESHFLVY